jgi:hypothetical protein
MSKVPWKLVLPFLGMALTYFGALYAGFDPCVSLWPDRCKAEVVQPVVPLPLDADAGVE